MLVLDSHAHCGLTLPFEQIQQLWQGANIRGGMLIPPVEEIYDRYDPSFVDSAAYQKKRADVHQYLKGLQKKSLFIYWFVWNDFQPPGEGFNGIKWHRHYNEPEYQYHSPACTAFIEEACARKLPILLEEEFENTLEFVARINQRTVVIIPHFGGLNGGYYALKRADLFEKPNIYIDTALASKEEIRDFAGDYGTDRILFGSDFPFGDPDYERNKVEAVFSGRDRDRVLAENLLALMEEK